MTTPQPNISLGRVETPSDFYSQISSQLFDGSRKIGNADTLADLLQEAKIEKVSVSQWDIPLENSLIIFRIFADLKITLEIAP